jgi:hypothetical protein
MFHLKDGFYFQRGPGSHVTIEIDLTGLVPPGYERKRTIEVTAEEWASVLASVCLRGENGVTHAEALAFHGDGLL